MNVVVNDRVQESKVTAGKYVLPLLLTTSMFINYIDRSNLSAPGVIDLPKRDRPNRIDAHGYDLRTSSGSRWVVGLWSRSRHLG